jgi:hypothetical protein
MCVVVSVWLAWGGIRVVGLRGKEKVQAKLTIQSIENTCSNN